MIGYFPEAKRIAEQCNQSILKKVNAIPFEASLPGSYWELAGICAIYFKNESFTREKDITP